MSTTSFRNYLIAAQELLLVEADLPPTSNNAYNAERQERQRLAVAVDAALDAAYNYGRGTPGNTFGWQATLSSVDAGSAVIKAGVRDVEKVASAVHDGWNATAKRFVSNPNQFSDTETLRQKGTLDAKIASRKALMQQTYAMLPEDEKEKDRVVARTLLKMIQ